MHACILSIFEELSYVVRSPWTSLGSQAFPVAHALSVCDLNHKFVYTHENLACEYVVYICYAYTGVSLALFSSEKLR